EAEARSTASREAAHVRELAITRQEQQISFEREQVEALDVRTASVAAELEGLDARREPARALLASRREAAAEANVEAARSEVFSALNSATALRHALEHAATARDRVAETLSKLDVEMNDAQIESERAAADRAAAAEGLRRAHEAIEATRIARSARESELASARIEHEWRARSVRSREHELAGLEARLRSLEE